MVLQQRYRHDLRMHMELFRACAILTHFAINDGKNSCGYRDVHNHRREEKQINIDNGKDNDGRSNNITSL